MQGFKAQVEEMVSSHFSQMQMYYINNENSRALAADAMIFTMPVVRVFFEGRESIRLIRNFSIDELRGRIERPYQALFS